jgi:predicted outer membrane repeat protein
MPRSLAAALLAAVITLVAATTASAAHVIPVTTCDEVHFRDALANLPHNAIVRFECDGKVPVTRDPIFLASTGPDDRLTIDGNGHHVVISGGPALWNAGPRTTLRDLTFAGGDNEGCDCIIGGGAVVTFTPLIVDHVLFRGNRATNAGGAILARAVAELHVRNSVFEDNSVLCTISSSGILGGGGAINVMAGGPTVIRNTIFRRNSATGNCTGGGAIMAPRTLHPSNAGPITITDSHFRDNRLEANSGTLQAGGGAIGVFNRTLSIDDTRFVGNDVIGPTADGPGVTGGAGIGFGGAVYVDQQTDGLLPPLTTQISDSRFEDNEPSVDRPGYVHLGGALAFRDLQGTPTVEHSKFISNHADEGGAIYTPTALSLDGSRLLGNVATALGGGLLVGDERVAVAHTDLIANRPQNCAVNGPVADLVLGLDVTERAPRGSCAALAASP